MAFLKFVRVAIAEAEHLLHDAHSPREVVLGFSEDVLKALATGTLPDIPEPPTASAAPAPVIPPANDPRVDALVAAVAQQQQQFQALLAVLAPKTEQLPTAVPVTTTAPEVFPVPKAQT